jgi:hypothetical protein
LQSAPGSAEDLMSESTVPGPGKGSATGTRFLENLAYLVPGYRGYKEKELRREEDARLRSRVLAKLHEVIRILADRLARLTEQSLDSAAEAVERRLRRIERLADAVRYAPYGFSGFFDAEKVREETLEHVLETDLLLFQDLDDSVEHLKGSPFPPRTKTALSAWLETLDGDIERTETRLLTRDKILGDC